MTRRLVVLASGNGSNLQAVLDACATGRLPASVALVVSDRPTAGALRRAATAGVPACVVAPTPSEPRPGFEARLADAVAGAAPDLVVLAGWMRLLGPAFLDRFPGRVVNLHPARPGDLPGLRAIERAHAEAVAGTRTRSGVMVHLVPDSGVDNGPVVAAVDVPVAACDSLASFATRMHAAEHRLLVGALARLCSHFHDLQEPTS